MPGTVFKIISIVVVTADVPLHGTPSQAGSVESLQACPANA